MGARRHSNLGGHRGLTGLKKTNSYGEIIKNGGPCPLVLMPMACTITRYTADFCR